MLELFSSKRKLYYGLSRANFEITINLSNLQNYKKKMPVPINYF